MKSIDIEKNDAEQRLDKFLKKLLKNANRSLIYKLNRKGKIKINGKKEDNEYKLCEGDNVKIFLKDEDWKNLIVENQSKEIINKLDKNDIMYEDKGILVINKSPFLNVHPGDHKTTEVSLIEQVHDYLGEKVNSLTFKPALAHRIDRNTSGIIMIGKEKSALDFLTKGFKNHSFKKIYLAIVFGKMKEKEGVINKKLLRIENAKGENKVQVSEKGQTATTIYKVIEEKVLETTNGLVDISILEVELKTGRTHQIRVHLADNQTPIVGDNTYGNKQLNSYIAKHFGLNRQALHYRQIEFFHAQKNKNICLKAELKNDIDLFINCLNKKEL